MYKMNKVRELKTDNTLWATPARIINLLDFDPEKLTIDKAPHIHQVRYQNGGFYLTIDNIKGYFKLDDNISSILDMILTDDQKNKYHQVWKEVFKLVNNENGKLKLHEKIRLCDIDLPIEKIFKIPSITIVIKSLIEKENIVCTKYKIEL